MENSLEKLEQIMKPYFDKKEEIERLSNSNENEVEKFKNELAESKEKREKEIAKLELRLARLRENRDREIEEYVASQPSFYAGYAATLRKDLEQAYKAQEDELTTEIMNLVVNEKEMNSEQIINSVNSRPNYNKVYLREMIEIKDSLRKSLIAEQKEITFALQREKINFDSVMLELSNFKYQYNDQHQVINGLEWKELYEKSNQISSKMNELRNSLKVVEEYLNLTELTKEEIAAGMSSLTPWEKAEYDRRNVINNQELPKPEKIEEKLPVIQELDEFDKSNSEDPSEILEQMEEIQKEVEEDKKSNDEILPNNIDNSVDSYMENEDENNNIVVDNIDELCILVYNDIVKEAENMRSIKLNSGLDSELSGKYSVSDNEDTHGTLIVENPVALPDGEYINVDDINNALNNYYNKNKGQNFIVKGLNKTLNFSENKVRNLKKILKQCSIVRLIQDKKISNLDVKRVYGKESYKNFSDMKEIGHISSSKPEGDYISRDQLIIKLNNMFTSKEKKLEWLKKLSTKVKSLRKKDEDNDVELDSMIQEEQQETIKQR